VSVELNAPLVNLNREISLLAQTLEQIAIGDVDLSALTVEGQAFNWCKVLVTIISSLLENIRRLAERSRKIDNLRQVIETKTASPKASHNTLVPIQSLLQEA
jgi:prefoldin subunit 5